MPEKKEITLARLKKGQSGTVINIQGGRNLADRLSAIGIRPGKRITKVSSMFLSGPVTVQVGQTQVAVGHGMARKILLSTDHTEAGG